MATQTHKICLHIYHVCLYFCVSCVCLSVYICAYSLSAYISAYCMSHLYFCVSSVYISVYISAYHLSCLSIYAYRLFVCLCTVSAYHQSLSMALSTLIRFRLKTHIFLSFLPFCPHWDGVFIFLKTLSKVDEFSRCVKTRWWRIFSHVTHIISIYIYVYTSIVPVMCYSLSHFSHYRFVTLYTLHITVL